MELARQGEDDPDFGRALGGRARRAGRAGSPGRGPDERASARPGAPPRWPLDNPVPRAAVRRFPGRKRAYRSTRSPGT